MVIFLEINGYISSSFIKRTCEPQPAVNEKENGNQQKTFAIIPYVKGVSELVARILGKFNIKTAFKPVKTLGHIFKKTKDRPSEWQVKGIVYKVSANPAHSRSSVNQKDLGIPGAVNTSPACSAMQKLQIMTSIRNMYKSKKGALII